MLEYLRIIGISESAFMPEDERWLQGIVVRVDKQPTYVYTISEKPISFIRTLISGDFALLAYFSTAPEYRLKKIGGQLLNYVMQELKKRGIKRIVCRQELIITLLSTSIQK